MRICGTITDDSGYLALIDPFAYHSFVAPQATFEDLRKHLLDEMSAGHCLVWGTGREDIWQVEIQSEFGGNDAFQSFTGRISATDSFLCLVEYSALYAAAIDSEVSLPSRRYESLVIPTVPDVYLCRVQQWHDHNVWDEVTPTRDTDFTIALLPATVPQIAWSHVPWEWPAYTHGNKGENAVIWQLYINSEHVGQLELHSIDQPWFHCTFAPLPSFAQWERAFHREAELLNGDDETLWEAALDEIMALDIVLIGADGTELREVLLHIHAENHAWFRY